MTFKIEILFKSGASKEYTVDISKQVKALGCNKAKKMYEADLIDKIIRYAIREGINASAQFDCIDGMIHIIDVQHIADFAYKFE